MISNVEINKSVDFEVTWEDSSSQLMDMSNVTFELYHYSQSSSAELLSANKEPYIISELLTDRLEVLSINVFGASSTSTLGFVELDLNIIVDQLPGLECPPNEFVVPNTNSKISIIGGRKVFALSAAELAALINLSADGFFAEDRNGYLVLKTETTGANTQITMNVCTISNVLGIDPSTTSQGSDTHIVFDVPSTTMEYISLGKYTFLGLSLSEPHFQVDKRYYVAYRATNPNTLLSYTKEEDFTLVKPKNSKLSYSFTR